MLHVNEITYRVAGRLLFERATLAINAGERVGLVGRNGCGKSTLLRLIADELHPDAGSVSTSKRSTIGRLSQDAPGGPESLIETVLAADRERTRLLVEAEEVSDPHRLAEVHERLATIRAASAPARAARILAGLGFDEAAQQRPCAEFSGGWRMRVALAALLFAAPDVLLLDEPTNHLDLEATLWLEGFLKSYPGTLVLVSHDRDLLNRVPQKIAHVENCKLVLYNGNYDTFERTRRERQERQAALRTRQLAQRRHIQSFIDRFRYKASKARQAQSRIKALERMEPIAAIVDERTVPFSFPDPEPLSPPLIALEEVSVGYAQDRPVLRGLDLRIDMDDRIALLGANGNGKSTLMRLFADRIKPQAGQLRKSGKLKVGYFAQDQAEELDLASTPLELMARALPMAADRRLRGQLGRFGFGADLAETKVANLSGGEKARLLFALMSREAPHLLLLDEPTNHLDVDSREALVQALNAYDGAVVLVTHDAHLVELVADRLWLVAGGVVRSFDGDMEDYRELLLARGRAERAEQRSGKAGGNGQDKKSKRKAAAETRQALSHLKKAAEAAEAQLAKLEAARRLIEERLADPGLYDGGGARLEELQKKHREVLAAIRAAEETWISAQSALSEA